jgi:DNA repair photolyase
MADPGLRLRAGVASARPKLPRVMLCERKGPALHSSPLAAGPEVLSLNVAKGCGHRCAFCSARAYANYPGDEVLYVFSDNVKRLKEELSGGKRKPWAVYVSPATDPFPPLAEIQAETVRVVETLAEHGVDSWLMTRGYIRPTALHVLAAHRERVRVTIGLTTTDRELQRVLEPLAAPPRLRLRQIAELRRLGIAVQVALEPLVPGLTDTRANLAELLDALAALGVRRVTAGYMFLRQGIRTNLIEALQPLGWDEKVLSAFAGGPVLEAPGVAPARYLPKSRRQRGYSALMALAAGLGITVSVSGVTNPDFRPPRRTDISLAAVQRSLPMF